MADNQTHKVDLRKAKDKLQELTSTLTPDLQLLNGLEEEIKKTLGAGATIRQIWLSLRESGFKGNQMKLSNWLEEKGIRQKLEKKGSGKRKKTEIQAKSQQAESQIVQTPQKQEQPAETNQFVEKTTADQSDFNISDDDY